MKKIFIYILLILCFIAQPSFCATDYYELGREAYAEGNYKLAQRCFWAVLNNDASNINARYYMAHTLVKQKKYDDASVEYRRIMQSAPYSQTAALAQESLKIISPYLSNETKYVEDSPEYSAKNDYFVNALSSKSQIMRWAQMPVSVYIPDGKYKETIKSAFQTWENGSKGIVSFTYVTNPQKAQIEVSLKNKIESSATERSYIAGLTKPYYKGINLVKVEVTLLDINPNTKQPQTKEKIYATALHEIGHALGMKGHSPNASDVMFASGSGAKKTLSARDYNTLKLLYQISPKSVQEYSGVIFKEKIKEANNYVKKYPDTAIGWLNLADLYRSSGDYDKAIETYNKALKIDKNQNEAYYFLGECYFKKKNYQQALSNYEQALAKQKDNKYYLHTFARVCVATNNKPLARKYLKSFLNRNVGQRKDEVVSEIINMLK